MKTSWDEFFECIAMKKMNHDESQHYSRIAIFLISVEAS